MAACIFLLFKRGSFQHESRIIQVANFPLHFCRLLQNDHHEKDSSEIFCEIQSSSPARV